jgi:hypothetical protein
VFCCGTVALPASDLMGCGSGTACTGTDCGIITDGSGPAFFSTSLLKSPIITPPPNDIWRAVYAPPGIYFALAVRSLAYTRTGSSTYALYLTESTVLASCGASIQPTTVSGT